MDVADGSDQGEQVSTRVRITAVFTAAAGAQPPPEEAMPSGEPASTQQLDASAAGFSASASIASSTTRTVDGGGVVYRVDSGFDLDQYLYRRHSPLDFYIDMTDDFGPVNEDGRPLPGNALYLSLIHIS